MSIKNNISLYKLEIESKPCKLIAVSKTHSIEKILEAYQAGQRVFGENKAQDLVAKWASLPKDIEWHMIGHLQTNKIKYIAPFVSLIHSVDSKKLLEEVNKQGKKVKRKISCLLQVHITAEETKFGFSEEELIALLESNFIYTLEFITIQGLMGMASFTADANRIRNEFKYLKNLFDKLKERVKPTSEFKELSMGMSSDYKIAIEEGSTMVRIGTAIFGDRDYSDNTNS
ncbi:MAG: YggS family pyridoxal phosphate-dependent enzyme [Bacteroidota bacterium]